MAIEKYLCEAMGLDDLKLSQQLIGQATALQISDRSKPLEENILGAMAFIKGIKPGSALEAILAVQMLGVHHAALTFLKRATAESQTFEGAEANVLRATRFLRLFDEQLEALSKLRGKTGQQKVTVEHVHVNSGGQAIVGAVTGTTPEGLVREQDASEAS